MPVELCLIDSNILLRWTQLEDPDFTIVRTALDRLKISNTIACYTSQNLGEFWNVLTRPINRNGYGFSPDETDISANVIEAEFRLLPDSLAVHLEWRRLLRDYQISGVQVHDARLVAAMRVHGVQRILTFNTRDFARFTDIQAMHPRQPV